MIEFEQPLKNELNIQITKTNPLNYRQVHLAIKIHLHKLITIKQHFKRSRNL